MTIIIVIVARGRAFEIVYDTSVTAQVRAIDRKYHRLIRTTIEEQLRFEPQTETQNRKPLLRPVTFDAEWELRFGPGNRFRVFYVVDRENWEVQILAIGVKEGSRLLIGGEEILL